MAERPRDLDDEADDLPIGEYFDEYSGRINCPYCGQGRVDANGDAQHAEDCQVERLLRFRQQRRAAERAGGISQP